MAEGTHPGGGAEDPRIAAFCASEGPEVFHAVAHRHEVGRPDPFDVPIIHEEARAAFRRLLARATTPPGLPAGRILLLKGEAGAGKTHLMRAFRNEAHARGTGYCGYMQMTTTTEDYPRYVLNNLIDSLDRPYRELEGRTSGLMRLSAALAASSGDAGRAALDQLCDEEMERGAVGRVIETLADLIVMDERFDAVDYDLIRALLFLQRNDPRIKSRVSKYLRCEPLSDPDRHTLGAIYPRAYPDAPERVVEKLGRLMWAVGPASLILCVDQLEDIYNLDDAPARFRRAMIAVADLADRIPSAIVVVACLRDFYEALRGHLTGPLIDRIENDPAPVLLKGPREEGEVIQLVARRLGYLHQSFGIEPAADDPTFPIPVAALRGLAGLRTRDVLLRCQMYRERCIAAGTIVPPPADLFGPAAVAAPSPPPAAITLDQAWNDVLGAGGLIIPGDEEGLADLLAEAITACADELPNGHRFAAEARGGSVPVQAHSPFGTGASLLIGICNKAAQGGALGKQVEEVERLAGGSLPVIVRSTEFPTNPKAAVVQQLRTLMARGGRLAVVEDADWRTMLALRAFREAHGPDPAFRGWLTREQPLTRLKSLRKILDLDHLKSLRPRPAGPSPSPGVPAPSAASATPDAG